MRRLRSRVLTIAVAGTAGAVLFAGAAGAAPPTPDGGGAGVRPADTTAPSGPPAPAGFSQQLIDIYAQVNTLAQQYPPKDGLALPSQDSFQAQIDSLTQDQLNQIYDANPGVWDQAQNSLNSAVSGTSTESQQVAKANEQATRAKKKTRKTTPKTVTPKLVRGGAVATPQAIGDTVDFPTPPTLVTCADEDTFEGLHATSFALGTSADSLTLAKDVIGLAADAIGFALAFAPVDLVEAGFTVDKDPIWGTLAEVQTGLVVAADALGIAGDSIAIAKDSIDNQAGVIADCYGVYGTQEQDYIFEAIQALGKMGNTILVNQGDLNAVINTGFSTTYQKLDNLQTSVNTAQASLDLALKERIESALLGGAPAGITDFQLPNSSGGYLDATPIGVKEVVTDAYHAMQIDHQPMGSGALTYLTLANSYLTGGHYKQAFAEYQLAYKAISKTSTTQGT